MLYITESIKLQITEEGILHYPQQGYGFLLGFEKREIRIIEKLFAWGQEQDLEVAHLHASLFAAENGLSVLGVFQTVANQAPFAQNIKQLIEHPHYSMLVLSVWAAEFINLQSWRLNKTFQLVQEKITVVNDKNYGHAALNEDRNYYINYN